jgi:hypothetical protein
MRAAHSVCISAEPLCADSSSLLAIVTTVMSQFFERKPNKITGPNAGGPRQFPNPTPLAARVGQFWRSTTLHAHAAFGAFH